MVEVGPVDDNVGPALNWSELDDSERPAEMGQLLAIAFETNRPARLNVTHERAFEIATTLMNAWDRHVGPDGRERESLIEYRGREFQVLYLIAD